MEKVDFGSLLQPTPMFFIPSALGEALRYFSSLSQMQTFDFEPEAEFVSSGDAQFPPQF